jgi:intracellular septation protein A
MADELKADKVADENQNKANGDQENFLANLAFNVVLPVVILRQLGKRLGDDGPAIALVVALAFPIAYGLRDFLKRRKVNVFSVIGFIGVLLTGGFGLLQLSPEWFVWKEAGVPLAIGLIVLGSCVTRNPLCRMVFHNPNLLQLERIEKKVPADDPRWLPVWRQTTVILAGSFFLSAVLNYLLARRVFTGIDPTLAEAAKAELLNEQIATMTWQGYVIIMLPCMVCMIGALLWMMRGIRNLTGLNTDEILVGGQPDDARSVESDENKDVETAEVASVANPSRKEEMAQ